MNIYLNNFAEDVDHIDISYSQLQAIEEQGASAFYLLDMQKLSANYQNLAKAFGERYPHCQIAYSFKTNYAPIICRHLKAQGAWAEVVSAMEYDIATNNVGFDPANIIVNGPVHDQDFIQKALLDGALFNVDSWYLLDMVERVCRTHPNRQFRIGIRLTYLIEDGGFTRFGIEADKENMARLAQWEAPLDNCEIQGFHSHYSNSSRSLNSFRSRIDGLLEASKSYFDIAQARSPKFINIGGGFFGEMPASLATQYAETPNFQDYADCICEQMHKHYPENQSPENQTPENQDVRLFLEPGTALVSNAMAFACKVYDVKIIDGRSVALVNGSNHNINHKWQGETLPMQLVKAHPENNTDSNFDVVGNTCIEKDVLLTGAAGEVEIGDYLVFQYMGGYTNVLKQPFIHPGQAIYAWDDGEMITVKRQESASDLMASYV